MVNWEGRYVKIKRIFDLTLSVLGLLILLPVLILTAILIKCSSPGPVLFKQERIGLNGQPFQIIKLRTMVVDAEKSGRQITVYDDPRITKVGKYLRKFKIDELPQLYNIFKGEMSLVGPRPEVSKYVEMYSEQQLAVLSVKPGITDYASIEFRNEDELLALSDNPEQVYIEIIMPYKLKLGLKYIKDMSLITDLKILLFTLLPGMRGGIKSR
ncbi:MAG: sugar transferase [Firmicutes bacterium]|nr:sugar transferase [Bacillota bacterium]